MGLSGILRHKQTITQTMRISIVIHHTGFRLPDQWGMDQENGGPTNEERASFTTYKNVKCRK